MLTLHYELNYYNVSYHFFADDTQIYFKFDSKDRCVSKLNTVLNAVETRMLFSLWFFCPFSCSYTQTCGTSRGLSTSVWTCADNRRTLRADWFNYSTTEWPIEGFCFRKIYPQPKKLIFALGAKVFVFEIKFNLNIKKVESLHFAHQIHF